MEILYEHDNALMKQRSKVNKRCVLHFAVKSSSTVTVQFVLNKDPEQMNKVDSMSRTPAHFAATVEQKEIITLLISRGADPMRKYADKIYRTLRSPATVTHANSNACQQ